MYGPHTKAVNSVSIYSKEELRNKAAKMSKKKHNNHYYITKPKKIL